MELCLCCFQSRDEQVKDSDPLIDRRASPVKNDILPVPDKVITEQFTEYEPDMKPVSDDCDTSPLLNEAQGEDGGGIKDVLSEAKLAEISSNKDPVMRKSDSNKNIANFRDSLCEPTAPRLYPEVPKTPEPVRIVPVFLPAEPVLPAEPAPAEPVEVVQQVEAAAPLTPTAPLSESQLHFQEPEKVETEVAVKKAAPESFVIVEQSGSITADSFMYNEAARKEELPADEPLAFSTPLVEPALISADVELTPTKEPVVEVPAPVVEVPAPVAEPEPIVEPEPEPIVEPEPAPIADPEPIVEPVPVAEVVVEVPVAEVVVEVPVAEPVKEALVEAAVSEEEEPQSIPAPPPTLGESISIISRSEATEMDETPEKKTETIAEEEAEVEVEVPATAQPEPIPEVLAPEIAAPEIPAPEIPAPEIPAPEIAAPVPEVIAEEPKSIVPESVPEPTPTEVGIPTLDETVPEETEKPTEQIIITDDLGSDNLVDKENFSNNILLTESEDKSDGESTIIASPNKE